MKAYKDLKNEVVLLLDGVRGCNLPQDFIAETEGVQGWTYNVSTEDIETLKAGPDEEWYWEAWNNVLDNAYFTYIDGTKGILYISEEYSDLFIIPEDHDFTAEDE